MQAVILAAGNSHRFYPFNNISHKSMTSLMGQTLLSRTLESLQKADIKKIIIVISSGSNIQTEIGNGNKYGVEVTYIVQKEKLGMGHALLEAQDHLEETFFLLNGYHFEIDEVAALMLAKQKNSQQIVLLTKKDTILDRYGVVEAEGERIVSIVEKPQQQSKDGLRLIGIYLLNRNFIEELKNVQIEHYHFEKALDMYAKKSEITYVISPVNTLTLKYPWDLLDVKDVLLTREEFTISPSAHVAKNVIIEGKVTIQDGVTIQEGACIKGPCFIGRNATIGNNAILRNGVIIEENAVVGAGMEIKNSILFRDATTHSGFIGDSIIGSSSRIAGNFCSGNVRFDRGHIYVTTPDGEINTHRTHFGFVCGEKVDTGIGVSVMPGIIIGSNVTIGPSTTIMKNIEDNILCYTKFETVIKKKHE